jgi:hypothetical protein
VSDSRLDQLWAAHEIRQLAYRYALAQDSRDRTLLLSLWSETAEPATTPDIDIHTVRSEAARWFQKGPTVHFVGNHVIGFDGPGAAHGSVYCWAQLDLGHAFVDQAILYEDHYVLDGGAWLFATRRHLLWYGQERDRNPIRQEPATWPRGHVGRGSLPEEFPSYANWASGR